MMPFITEELYQKLPDYDEKQLSISVASYPNEIAEWSENGPAIEEKIEYLMNIVKQIRSLASSVNLPPSAKPDAFFVFVKGIEGVEQYRNLILNEAELIITLSKAKEVK